MDWKNSITRYACTMLLLFSSQACGIYSFTGAANAAKTIQIDTFFNNTELAPPSMSTVFTNGLKDYIQQNSSLSVSEEDGELRLEGVIDEYKLSPQAPVNNQEGISSASQTRLTISVKVNYVDTMEPKNSFKNRTFSFFKNFDSDRDFISIQEETNKEILSRIYLDIFNATIANW